MNKFPEFVRYFVSVFKVVLFEIFLDFCVYFLNVSLGLGTIRTIVGHDIDVLAHPGRVVVIDSWLGLRVRLGSDNARTGQVIFAIFIDVVRIAPQNVV